MTLDAYLTIDALNTITGIFPTQAMADTFETNNAGSTALDSQITGMPNRVDVGWCYHLASNEVWEEHPLYRPAETAHWHLCHQGLLSRDSGFDNSRMASTFLFLLSIARTTLSPVSGKAFIWLSTILI